MEEEEVCCSVLQLQLGRVGVAEREKGSMLGMCELYSVIKQGGGSCQTIGVVRGRAWPLQLTDYSNGGVACPCRQRSTWPGPSARGSSNKDQPVWGTSRTQDICCTHMHTHTPSLSLSLSFTLTHSHRLT